MTIKVAASLALLIAALCISHFLFGYKPPGWMVFGLYVLILLAVQHIVRTGKPRSEPEKFSDWPTSGPIGRFGQHGLMLAFAATGILCLLNPIQLVQFLAQGIGNTIVRFQRSRVAESQADRYQGKVSYTLPFNGEWLVYNGGPTADTSHSWEIFAQRYAYDFVIADKKHRRHRGRGTRLTEYYCFNAEILAAADGEVVAVVDGIRSAPFVGYGILDMFARSFIGNHIIIQHAEREFTLYGHLLKGTLSVSKGDRVRRGQIIGHCGNSGHSAEPHLHFHLQDRKNFYASMGLPIRFTRLTANGGIPILPFIEVGDYVRQH